MSPNLTAKTALTTQDISFLKEELPKLLNQSKTKTLSRELIYDKVKDFLELRTQIDVLLFGQALSHAIKQGSLSEFASKKGRYGGVTFAELIKDKPTVTLAEFNLSSQSKKEEDAEEIAFVVEEKEEDEENFKDSIPDGYVENFKKEENVKPSPVQLGASTMPPVIPSWGGKKEIKSKFKIRDKEYELPWPEQQVKALFEQLFCAKEDQDGELEFNRKKYKIDWRQLMKDDPREVVFDVLDKSLFFVLNASVEIK